jgi:hypothetical protein
VSFNVLVAGSYWKRDDLGYSGHTSVSCGVVHLSFSSPGKNNLYAEKLTHLGSGGIAIIAGIAKIAKILSLATDPLSGTDRTDLHR